MLEFKLPAIGEGVVEGEIVRWLKQAGDTVALNEPLVEVMTDKATVEIPAPVAGVVTELRAAEGDVCAVGQVLAILGDDRATRASVPSPAPGVSAELARPGGVLATPAARQAARELGVDLEHLGSNRGRITKDDVVRAGAPTASPTSAAHGPGSNGRAVPGASAAAPDRVQDGDEFVPFRGLRRRIAEGMTRAYTTAVHYTYVEQVDVNRLVELRNQAKQAASEEGVALTYLPFIVKAVVHALKKFPMVNAELDEANARIVLKKHYDIGIATATENGLMVPVLHGADRMSLLDIARETARVSEAARKGTATLHELTGSTFTITSLGTIGGVLATPILNYPEVGILGVHAIRKVPVVDEHDRIIVGQIMNLSISLDHRVVDGYEGAMFLQEVRRYLEDPTLLLLASI